MRAIGSKRSWSFSLGVHAGVTLLALGLSRALPPPRAPRAPLTSTVEFDFTPPAPPPPTARTESPAPAARTEAPEAARARAMRHTNQPHAPSPEPDPEPSGTIGPAPVTPTPAPTAPSPTPVLTAANILRQGDALVDAMAAAGPAVPSSRRTGAGSGRDIFGGGERPSIGEIAGGPIHDALAENNHTNPAGTMTYDRELARRAEEFFLPVRSIPDLGTAVSNAQMTGLSAIDRTPSDGEIAAGGALDATHSQAFTMVQMRNLPPPPFHLVRADVEVVQSPNGGVRSATVVRRSGVRGFDEQALNAIRDAVPEVGANAVGAARRTRWAFEVSNAQGASAQIVGGGNEGWTLIHEPSNGVHLRMRVRRLSVTLLPGS